jgi:hypothetical protein
VVAEVVEVTAAVGVVEVAVVVVVLVRVVVAGVVVMTAAVGGVVVMTAAVGGVVEVAVTVVVITGVIVGLGEVVVGTVVDDVVGAEGVVGLLPIELSSSMNLYLLICYEFKFAFGWLRFLIQFIRLQLTNTNRKKKDLFNIF